MTSPITPIAQTPLTPPSPPISHITPNPPYSIFLLLSLLPLLLPPVDGGGVVEPSDLGQIIRHEALQHHHGLVYLRSGAD